MKLRQLIRATGKRYKSDNPGRLQLGIDLSVSFDTLNSTSVSTMEKVLDILQDAEVQGPKPKNVPDKYFHIENIEADATDQVSAYVNKFSSRFGQEIFAYNVVKFLNDKEIVARNSSLWQDDPKLALAFYQIYIERFKRAYESMPAPLFKGREVNFNVLNPYQAMTKMFQENNSKCHNMIKKDLRPLSARILTHAYSNHNNRFDYRFPKLKIPVAQTIVESPLILSNAVGITPKTQTNLLAYILQDSGVISQYLQNIHSELDPKMVLSMIWTQVLEGSILFKVMVKKKLQLVNELENRKLILEFLENDSENPAEESDIDIVKAIIAAKSAIPSRILYDQRYKNALRQNTVDTSDDKVVIKVLAEYFDRFFAITYRKNPALVDTWILEFIEYYITHSSSDHLDELLKESLAQFRTDIGSVATLELFQLLWKKIDRAKK